MIQSIYLYRHYFRYLPLIVWVIFLFACSDDSLVQKPEGTMETVSVTIQTRATAAELIPAEEINEYHIETLRVYVFSSAGKLLGYHYGKVDKPGSSLTFTLKLPTGTHTFYTIANEDEAKVLKIKNKDSYLLPGPKDNTEANLEELEKLITPNILQSLTFSELPEAIPDSKNDSSSKDETGKTYTSPLLPMASKQEAIVTPNGSVDISLIRSVAKMQFYFSTTGPGDCYIGRGIYLYNEPKYGYLFPHTFAEDIDRKETFEKPNGWKENPFYSDSYNHQLNGRIILNCGWPEEPEGIYIEDIEKMKLLDINKIIANKNDPNNPRYDYLPKKSFYLFANPLSNSNDPIVSSNPPTGNGYYLKILLHEHKDGSDGAQQHAGEKFYLTLPEVKANDRLSIYSVVTLDGYTVLTPHWIIEEWKTGGGDIEFN